jgi:hypothetical protein
MALTKSKDEGADGAAPAIVTDHPFMPPSQGRFGTEMKINERYWLLCRKEGCNLAMAAHSETTVPNNVTATIDHREAKDASKR